MTEIRLDNITKVYGSGAAAARAVDDVSLTIASGELFFLLGPSGCGKTTLLRMIAGLVEPTAGRVWFGQQDVTVMEAERRKAAMVFQSYALWPHMTVAQNVEFGPKMQGLAKDRRQELVAANLARVEMSGYEKRKPNQLSGGQQQRVAVARALAAGGDCLLLDEPLSNLDARLRLHMRTELRKLVKQTGLTGVYVTHDQAEALSMADRIAVMNAGRVVQVGTPQELYDRPNCRFVADFLGEANFIEGKLTSATPAVVATPVGEIRCADRSASGAGSAVTCCIRPERISIGKANGQNALAAVVEGVTYLGQMRQFACRLANGIIWRVSAMGDHGNIKPGDSIALGIRDQDVIVLER